MSSCLYMFLARPEDIPDNGKAGPRNTGGDEEQGQRKSGV